MSLTRVDQQQQLKSNSVRRSSLIVNLSTSTKKRSSVTTLLTSSILAGGSSLRISSSRSSGSSSSSSSSNSSSTIARRQHYSNFGSFDFSPPPSAYANAIGCGSGASDASLPGSMRNDGHVRHSSRLPQKNVHYVASPQSAPPFLCKPSYSQCSNTTVRLEQEGTSSSSIGGIRPLLALESSGDGKIERSFGEEIEVAPEIAVENLSSEQQQQQSLSLFEPNVVGSPQLALVVETTATVNSNKKTNPVRLNSQVIGVHEVGTGGSTTTATTTKTTTTKSKRATSSEQSSRRNSKEESPEPIVEVKNTSSSSSARGSSASSLSPPSSDCEDSTKLVRRRTVRRYHRATEEQEEGGPTRTITTTTTTTTLEGAVGGNDNADDDEGANSKGNKKPTTAELTISINQKSEQQARTKQEEQEQQQQQQEEIRRSHFRTRQIGTCYGLSKERQQQQQQQTKTSALSSSSTLSTSKIAKSSTITTNRKSTTSHHHHQHKLVSESSSSLTSAQAKQQQQQVQALDLTNKKQQEQVETAPLSSSSGSSKMNRETTATGQAASGVCDGSPGLVAPPAGARIVRPTLELRLNNQFKGDLFDRGSSVKNGLLESAGSRSIAVEEEEESSVHHRESISTTMSSTRGTSSTSSLRKSEAISSSSSSSEAAALLSRRSNISSSDLSSSRHFKTHSASLIVSGDSKRAKVTGGGGGGIEQIQVLTDSAAPFLNSETIFSSPDVRSLVKEIGTEFAELENALSSATAAASGHQFSHHHQLSGSSKGVTSLSTRLFGRRLLSPVGSAPHYPAINNSSSNQTLYEDDAPTTRQQQQQQRQERNISPTICHHLSSAAPTARTTDANSENDARDNSTNSAGLRSSSTGVGSGVDSRPTGTSGRYSSFYTTAFGAGNEGVTVTQAAGGPNGQKIKELMTKAQIHADRYGSSSTETPTTGNKCDEPAALTATTSGEAYGKQSAACQTATTAASGVSMAEPEETNNKSIGTAGISSNNHRTSVMTESIERIDQGMSEMCKKFSECSKTNEAIGLLKIMIQMIEKAWSVPVCGDDLGFKLCNSLREAEGLDIILGFIHDSDEQQTNAANEQQQQQQAATDRSSSWATVLLSGPDGNDGEKLANCNSFDRRQQQPKSEQQQQWQQVVKQQSNAQAKNNNSLNPLRLNLSKLNQVTASATDELITASSTASPQVMPSGGATGLKQPQSAPGGANAKDSDSDILTSDLGLDSTSVESLSYVSATQAPSSENAANKCDSPSDLTKQEQQQQKQLISIDATIAAIEEAAKRDQNETEDDLDLECEPMTMPAVASPTIAPTAEHQESLLAEQEHEHEHEHEQEQGGQEQAVEEEARLRKEELVFLSARLLSQCLTSDNRDYIVENGLCALIKLACSFTTMKQQTSQSQRWLSRNLIVQQQSVPAGTAVQSSPLKGQQPQQQVAAIKAIKRQHQQQLVNNSNSASEVAAPPNKTTQVIAQVNAQATTVGAGQQQNSSATTAANEKELHSSEYSDMYAIIGTEILQHLFKHSEDTCSKIISLGGLQAILYGCRSSNVEILRHCASALANLALYGGSDSQQTMIEQKAHVWLFPLAFNEDDNIQYYACLAIVVLAANQEIEADVLKSSTLDLVEPFVTSHEPQKFAESTTAHIHGQSASWLRKLIPLLESKREEARNLACFHFAMEAYIKKEQGQTQVFKNIDAVEPLRKVGSSPIAIASKFACQALRLIGEKEPHKLSQQVPLWTSEDVMEWVCQIGFERFKPAFVESRVDGDLLLQLDDDMLTTDIGIENGIIRRRFLRELSNLKRIADYSSVDRTGLSSLLATTGGDFIQYIYPMLQLGVTRDNIHLLDCEQLLRECNIANTIHRMKLAHSIKELQEKMAMVAASNECNSTDGADQKTLDVFVSYRRANGSQLASLLKVHLQLRGFSVFIDVERLEAGKFDNNLLDSIKAAKNFILVLSPNALDRCIDDHGCKDWVHKEIVAALASNCNIIPIIDNFLWPDAEQLPEDMRSITYFNGVRWIHDYQDACVDKVERFIRGEINNGGTILSCSSAQSSLQRLPGGAGPGNYSATPSIVATPSISAFPSSSGPVPSSRGPPSFVDNLSDNGYHPLSFAGQYLQQHQHSQNQSQSIRHRS